MVSTDRMKLADLGEEEVVRRLVAGLPQDSRILVGPGDDCAVVDAGGEDLLLLKTDAVVSGVHFLETTEPVRIGWKAAARVVSDFGAMGGSARELLVTLAAPGDYEVSRVEGFYQGLTRCAEQFGASIVGGETVGLPTGCPVMLSISGTGRVSRDIYVTRAGGRAGDRLYVTGQLGGSFESERHLDFVPRVAEGQWLACHVRAMMDLSDGLRRDLPRLARASGCGFQVKLESLPCHEDCKVEQALNDGEDMELLFAAEGGEWEDEFRQAFPDVKLTCVGSLQEQGNTNLGKGGWQHFTKGEEE